jgi:hypothetical protein
MMTLHGGCAGIEWPVDTNEDARIARLIFKGRCARPLRRRKEGGEERDEEGDEEQDEEGSEEQDAEGRRKGEERAASTPFC